MADWCSSSQKYSIVWLGNHTSVWGSWYDLGSGQWGFACCHSVISNSYCTGEAGIEASKASSAQQLLKDAPSFGNAASSSSSTLDVSSRDRDTDRRQEEASSRKKHGLGEGEIELDQDRLAAALKAEKRKRNGDAGEEEWQRDKRLKQAGSTWGNASTEVTEEELEAYRMARIGSTEDPVSVIIPNPRRKNLILTTTLFTDGKLYRRRAIGNLSDHPPTLRTPHCILLSSVRLMLYYETISTHLSMIRIFIVHYS